MTRLDQIMTKVAAKLTTNARKHIKTKNFGVPSKADSKDEKAESGNYPIRDRAHARSALSYGARFLNSGAYAKLKARVYKKYPTIGGKSNG